MRGIGFEFQADRAAITVLFVNGIGNAPQQAIASSEALILAMQAAGVPPLRYSFSYFYNAADGLGDDAELLDQAAISNFFLSTAASDRDNYYRLLGAFYNAQYASIGALSGVRARVVSVAGRLKQRIEETLSVSGGVVLVPHSQGNFYTEAAYAMLVADGKVELTKRIRVVGVASVAATTPSFRYLTHGSDRAVNGFRVQTGNLTWFTPLSSNATACIGSFCGEGISWSGFIDGTAHGFQEVYLNPVIASQSSGLSFPRTIYDMVMTSLVEIEAAIKPPPPPANPIVVFDNLGDRQFCTTTSTSVSCSGEPIGFIPGFGTIIPPQLQVKAAISFVAPSSCPCDVTKVELPIYLSAGGNDFFITFRRDFDGLPDVTASGLVAEFWLQEFMRTVSSFAANPPFTTTVKDINSGVVLIQPNLRYWLEISAPDTTRAVWPFGRTGAAALVATTRSGNPYASLGDAAPATRITVTPR